MGEASARIGPLLATMALLAGAWLLGRLLYDRTTAFTAVLALALSPYVWVTGRLLLTDMFLAAGVVWAMAGYVMAAEAPKNGWRSSAGMSIVGLALAAAWLAKGPIGLLLPLFGIVPFWVAAGREARIGLRGWLLAGGLLVLLGAPWFLTMSVRDPSFAEFFFLDEHVLRYFTGSANRPQAWYFYPITLLAGLFPASVLLPWAVYRMWPRRPIRSLEHRASLLLIGSALLTLLLFTLSRSKLATYVVPAAPAFAIIIGRAIRQMLRPAGGAETIRGDGSGERLPWGARASFAAWGVVGLAVAGRTGWMALHPAAPLQPTVDLIAVPACLGLACFVLAVCAWFGTRRVLSRILPVMVVLGFATLIGAEMLLERLDPVYSVKPAAMFVRQHAGPGDLIASYGRVLHGVTFYTERRTAIVGGPRELSFGARRGAHEGWVVPYERMPDLLSSRRVFLVLPSQLEERAVRESAGKVDILFRSPAYIVLGPPSP
jgi:4-amino-4-deoxy-L-arabinose transferase-like glycosyltransferase